MSWGPSPPPPIIQYPWMGGGRGVGLTCPKKTLIVLCSQISCTDLCLLRILISRFNFFLCWPQTILYPFRTIFDDLFNSSEDLKICLVQFLQ